jgi:methionyl-tRNA formyltransferase
MRPAYAGTHRFAELVLSGLLGTRHRPVAVITNPDRPRGRHGTPQAPPIKVQAVDAGLPVLQPERASAPEAIDALLATGADVLVVCAYGQILSQAVLDAIPTIVVHPSMVPKWRGAAPVEWALMAGETRLGVTVLKMTAGVDEGPVGAARTVDVPRDADAGRAYALLAEAAVAALLATMDGMADGSIEWVAQAGEPTHAAKLSPEDKDIDWRRPALESGDQVRALSPHIGAVTELLGRRTRIWRAVAGSGPPPAAGGERLIIPAAEGWLEVLELQQEGRKRMTAQEFLRGAGRILAQR